MLPNLSGLPLLHRAAVNTKGRPRLKPPELLRLETLPHDVLARVLGYAKGMSCKQAALMCKTSSEFNKVCQNPMFWEWQSQLRGYDRESRVEWHFQNVKTFAGGEWSWKAHYRYWCQKLRLADDTIRDAVNQVKRQGKPYTHPEYGPIADWDVSSVTSMDRMFEGARSFNGDLSKWDVSSVTNMSHMFVEAESFNGDLSNWDVSSVTDMRHMFFYAESFNGDLSNWDVSSVTNMSHMFEGDESFNGDVSKWDVSNVTSMDHMFENAKSFNGDLSNWDVSSVTSMDHMFEDAKSFNGDLSKWDVSSVTSMKEMFKYTGHNEAAINIV